MRNRVTKSQFLWGLEIPRVYYRGWRQDSFMYGDDKEEKSLIGRLKLKTLHKYMIVSLKRYM